jgi:hypothetical protein
MLSEEEKKIRNRACALRYYHRHKELKEDTKPKPTTLEEYKLQKQQYYREYHQKRKELKGAEKNEGSEKLKNENVI